MARPLKEMSYLEEKRERHPLVVAVEGSVLSVFVAQARLGDLGAHILTVHSR